MFFIVQKRILRDMRVKSNVFVRKSGFLCIKAKFDAPPTTFRSLFYNHKYALIIICIYRLITKFTPVAAVANKNSRPNIRLKPLKYCL